MMDEEMFIQHEEIVKTEGYISDGYNSANDDNLQGYCIEDKKELWAYLNSAPDYKDDQSSTLQPSYERNMYYGNDPLIPDHCFANDNETDIKAFQSSKPKKTPTKAKKSSKTSKSRVKAEQKPAKELVRNILFECTICMFETGDEEELKEHMLEHIGGPDTETFIEESLKGESYSCFFCPFTSYTKELFADHIQHSHAAKPYSPSKRSKKMKPHMDNNDYKGRRDRSQKRNGDSGENSYNCAICAFSSNSKKVVMDHEVTHKESDLFVCPECKYSTDSRRRFDAHMDTHNLDRPYPCKICWYRGKTKSGLNQHRLTHGEQKFKCRFCDYRSCKQARVTRHERIHTGEKPYACSQCDFRCNQEGTLIIHNRRHTGERPYECDVCTFKTISCSSLNTHKKKHMSGKREFECEICAQMFASALSLKRHLREHVDGQPSSLVKRRVPANPSSQKKIKTRRGKKKQQPSINSTYKCSFCDFQCTKFSELTRHLESHKKENPRKSSSPQKQAETPTKCQCPQCGMVLLKRRELRIHMKAIHGFDEISEEKGELDSVAISKNDKKDVTIKIGGYLLSVSDT